MRKITDHQVEGAETNLTIHVTDEPGAGGAHHRYQIDGFSAKSNKSWLFMDSVETLGIVFQNGGIPDNGPNGVTVEALLAICADRLQCFQAGPFACESNQKALDNINSAMEALHSRTKDRVARQVEGREVA